MIGVNVGQAACERWDQVLEALEGLLDPHDSPQGYPCAHLLHVE